VKKYQLKKTERTTLKFTFWRE